MLALAGIASLVACNAMSALAATSEGGGEASLKLPDLSQGMFLNNAINGRTLLMIGLIFCALGMGFGLAIYMNLKKLPVHRAMRESPS